MYNKEYLIKFLEAQEEAGVFLNPAIDMYCASVLARYAESQPGKSVEKIFLDEDYQTAGDYATLKGTILYEGNKGAEWYEGIAKASYLSMDDPFFHILGEHANFIMQVYDNIKPPYPIDSEDT
jgi:hypothetical protein